ncbi:T9SS type A sorting domain-containing protein [uncultured Dokdonia sp.]|uniref:T9SS type A sorting domain-containing protein n=1 Tax=uncultured Dokdonia sp. TaxID=575653 RepID=UPI00260AE7CA|nr:T9SS type A sorting domain-containing protein [uncultured Dokdonia sp.]
MKKITLFVLAFIVGIAVNAQTTISQNTDDTVTGANAVGCPGGDNDWARLFILSDFFIDNSADFTLNSGAFGVQTTDATGVSATVTIFGATADFPATFDDTNILGTQDVTIDETAVESIVTFDFDTPIVVPAGTEAIVYAITTPLGNNLFVGGTIEETAEGFLRSVQCGVTDYTLPTDIGFPDAHFYMTLTSDDAVLGVEDDILNDNVSVYPNPTNGDLNINFARNFGTTTVDIINVNGQKVLNASIEGFGNNTIATSKLANGIYFAQISNDTANTTIKFIKN